MIIIHINRNVIKKYSKIANYQYLTIDNREKIQNNVKCLIHDGVLKISVLYPISIVLQTNSLKIVQ